MQIFLTRHGQSVYNMDNRVGGDPGLTRLGRAYAKKIRPYLIAADEIWTSSLRRTKETAAGFKTREWSELDEIKTGIWDHYVYDQIDRDVLEKRGRNKFRFRYERGESYLDVVRRLQPLFDEIERRKNENVRVFIIAHKAVLRMVLAFLSETAYSVCVHSPVRLHALMRFIYSNACWREEKCGSWLPAPPSQSGGLFSSRGLSVQA